MNIQVKILNQGQRAVKQKSVRYGNVCSEEEEDASIWVQCENKKCLKWRKITSEELEKVSKTSTQLEICS